MVLYEQIEKFKEMIILFEEQNLQLTDVRDDQERQIERLD